MNNRIRSTSKEVKAKIQAHIIERLDPDYEDRPLTDRLEIVVKGLNDWKVGRRFPYTFDAFMGYLRCVPSTLEAEFATYYQEQALIEWLGEPTKEYEADEIEQRYYALIFREFRTLCELHGVKL